MNVVTKLSPWSVADTVARLTDEIALRGLKLFAVIDHSGEAQAVDLELRDTKLVVFGSPQAGTAVMQAAPLAAHRRGLLAIVIEPSPDEILTAR
jgi:uncharacterized protein (DUF302 family)